MLFKIMHQGKGLAAQFTRVKVLLVFFHITVIDLLVACKMCLSGKGLVTFFTLKGSLSCVYPGVGL